jgi:predicted GNAT family acetyltransferase
MATVDKNFRIKNGLVVEGSTATVNGQNILTEVGSDQYILDLVGGENLIDSVASGLSVDGNSELSIDRTVVDTWYDANGAAATAQSNAEDYADGLASNYDPAGAAATAQSNAEDYADGLASNYEAAGAVSTHAGLTSTHGVTGDIVGTTDTQDISNKRIIDTLYFTDGVTINNEGEIAVRAVSHDFDVQANYGDLNLKTVAEPEGVGSNVNISSLYGDIVLTTSENKNAYISSVNSGNEIATRSYVDSVAQGLDVKQSVKKATVGNITLSGEGLNDDGTEYWSNERVLVKEQTNNTENGIYVVNEDGAWERSEDTTGLDQDGNPKLSAGAFTFDESFGKGYVLSENLLYWSQFSEAGSVTAGNGISLLGSEISIDRTVVDTWYDANGAAATAQSNAEDYADGLASNYDPAGAAATAQSNAEDYADGLASNYDAAGVAAGLVDNLTNGTTAFTEINVNSVAKQIAATTGNIVTAAATTAYSWAKASYRSAEFLVKSKTATHTEITKIMLTLDSSDNVYLTEYGMSSTSGTSLQAITADVSGTDVRIRVTPANANTEVLITGTLLV